jgi:hypothetical protein
LALDSRLIEQFHQIAFHQPHHHHAFLNQGELFGGERGCHSSSLFEGSRNPAAD